MVHFFLWYSHTDLCVPTFHIHILHHSSLYLYFKFVPVVTLVVVCSSVLIWSYIVTTIYLVVYSTIIGMIVSRSALTPIFYLWVFPISLTSLIITINIVITHCLFRSFPPYSPYLFSLSLIFYISSYLVDFYPYLLFSLLLIIILQENMLKFALTVCILE